MIELVQVTTADGLRLDGALHPPAPGPAAPRAANPANDPSAPFPAAWLVIHGTGSNFYGSTFLEAMAADLQSTGAAVLVANTRGHDLMSVSSGTAGPKRLGAAYENVDDCRWDLAAWLELLWARGYAALGLAGHSLGGLKALYLMAQQPAAAVRRLVAWSPPRLSHQAFATSIKSQEFSQAMRRAEELVAQEKGQELLEVRVPLPMVISAAGYVDKYGPAENYNLLRWLDRLAVPTLITFGSQELSANVAFRGFADQIEQARPSPSLVEVAVVAGADHAYSGCRAELASRQQRWLRSKLDCA